MHYVLQCLSLLPLGPSRRGPWELGCLYQFWHVVRLNHQTTTRSFLEASVNFLVLQKGLLTNSGEDRTQYQPNLSELQELISSSLMLTLLMPRLN